MPYTTLVPDAPILASWANTDVRDQVVSVFASNAARDAAITSPVNGMLCFTTDSGRYWSYTGGSWVRVGWNSSTARTAVVRRRAANQSIPHNTNTDISFDTTDFNSDAAFITNATTFTIPSGLDGLYAMTFTLFWGSGGGSEFRRYVQLNINSGTLVRNADSFEDQLSVHATFGMSAGNTIQCETFQNSGAAINALCAFHAYRIGA